MVDKACVEQLMAALLDQVFERLQVKDRVERVHIFLEEPLGIEATIRDETSRGGLWTVSAEEHAT